MYSCLGVKNELFVSNSCRIVIYGEEGHRSE